jgi:hypothetical protein
VKYPTLVSASVCWIDVHGQPRSLPILPTNIPFLFPAMVGSGTVGLHRTVCTKMRVMHKGTEDLSYDVLADHSSHAYSMTVLDGFSMEGDKVKK